MEKICKNCGLRFIPTHNAQRHCCDKCRREYTLKHRNKETLKSLNCKYCGQPFNSLRKRSYCSDFCRLKANGRKPHQPTKRKKPAASLAEISRLARECGLTYGEYVAKYNC